MRLVPGDPIELFYSSGDIGGSSGAQPPASGGEVSRAALERLRESYNLDKSVPHQFVLYVWDVLRARLRRLDPISPPRHRHNQGSRTRNHSADSLQAWPSRLSIGLGAGIISAIRRHSSADYGAQVFAILGVSFPSFLPGHHPHLDLRDQPELAARNLERHRPAAHHARYYAREPQRPRSLARLTRSSMLDVLSRDYIRTARAKGLIESAS